MTSALLSLIICAVRGSELILPTVIKGMSTFSLTCYLRIKSALFFDDLKFKSALTQNDKKDVI